MRNRLCLALSLAALARGASHGAESGAAESAGIYAAVDQNIAEAMKSVQRLKECKNLTQLLRADYERKDAELRAEFGRIPPAFDVLMNSKNKRLNKQETVCLAEEPQAGALFMKAHDALRGIEPSSLPGIAERQKRLAKARLAYNQLVTPAKKDKH